MTVAHVITTPSLPFEPEPLESLVARFPAAVAEEFDSAQIFLWACSGLQSPPASSRKHVFDFLCGLRMIATAERIPTGRSLIHVSLAMVAGEISREEALELNPLKVLAPFIGSMKPTFVVNSGVALHLWLAR